MSLITKGQSPQISLSCLCLFFSTLSLLSAQTPYEHDSSTHAVMLGSSIGLSLAAEYLDYGMSPLSDETIGSLDRSDVNAFDRSATYNYSSLLNNLSYVTVAACLGSPLSLLASAEIRSDAGYLGIMYLETLLLSYHIPSFAKTYERARPYVYNEKAPYEEKRDDRAGRSFFSAHTSTAFSSAVFLGTVFSDCHPESQWKPAVWAASLSMASLTGYLRYESGYHFPTDIIAGALTGSLIGYVIPFIYRSDAPFRVSLFTGTTDSDLSLSVGFAY